MLPSLPIGSSPSINQGIARLWHVSWKWNTSFAMGYLYQSANVYGTEYSDRVYIKSLTFYWINKMAGLSGGYFLKNLSVKFGLEGKWEYKWQWNETVTQLGRVRHYRTIEASILKPLIMQISVSSDIYLVSIGLIPLPGGGGETVETITKIKHWEETAYKKYF
jgi:hypothetical protein